MRVKIISVGNKTSAPMAEFIATYEKRLPKHISLTWQFIKNGSGSTESSKQQETESILRTLQKTSQVILLDEAGSQLSSPDLSDKLFAQPKDVTLIIGGAHGVTDEIKQRADFIWSLSELVFPHEIVRLLLAEQLYRAYTISIGHPYHHS